MVPPKRKKTNSLEGSTVQTQGPKALKPVKEKNKEARRLIFRRNKETETPKSSREDIILALNRALADAKLPDFIRVVDAGYMETGAISVLLGQGSLGSMVLPGYGELLVAVVCKADKAVVSAELPEQWYQVKVHGIPRERYLTLGLGLAREEIELGTEYKLKRDPKWLRNPEEFRGESKKGSTIVVTVGTLEEPGECSLMGSALGDQEIVPSTIGRLGQMQYALGAVG